jgi:hypothetical protein
MTKKYQMLLVVDIETDNYDDAMDIMKNHPESGKIRDIQPVTSYEHDNEGQRVFYLHAEDKPLDA